jgi:hypothetical protein
MVSAFANSLYEKHINGMVLIDSNLKYASDAGDATRTKIVL